jgi:hypothetical protein
MQNILRQWRYCHLRRGHDSYHRSRFGDVWVNAASHASAPKAPPEETKP